jgi:hypothetical protein
MKTDTLNLACLSHSEEREREREREKVERIETSIFEWKLYLPERRL